VRVVLGSDLELQLVLVPELELELEPELVVAPGLAVEGAKGPL